MGLQSVESENLSFYARKILNKIESSFRIIPLNSLRNQQYTLKHPVYISIQYENDQVIASFDDVEAFSYSDNEFEAVDLLCQEIVTLYDELLEDKDQLGPLPQKWLITLQNHITYN